MRNTVLAGLLALALPGCLVGTGDISSDPGAGGTQGGGGGGQQGGGGGGDQGGGGGGGGGMTPTPKVAGTVDKTTVSTELQTTTTLNYTITGTDGFSGAVTVTPSVVDAQGSPVTGWTLTANPASVTLDTNGTANVALTVMIPSDNAALTPTVKLGLASTAAAVDVSSAFTIKNQVTIAIDAGTGTSSPHTTLPQPNSRLTIHSGTKVIFHNADTVNHRIHADGGIAHEPTDLTPGNDYVTTPSGDADWYCHDHEGSTEARLVNVIP